jgi:hypothetical protein
MWITATILVVLGVAIAKALPLVFGGAARSQLAGFVPVSVSGLPPALAVAPQRAHKGRKGKKNGRGAALAVRGLMAYEEPQCFELFYDPLYSSLSCNVYHIDYGSSFNDD